MTSEQAKQLGDDAVTLFAEAIEAGQSDALKACLDLKGHPSRLGMQRKRTRRNASGTNPLRLSIAADKALDRFPVRA